MPMKDTTRSGHGPFGRRRDDAEQRTPGQEAGQPIVELGVGSWKMAVGLGKGSEPRMRFPMPTTIMNETRNIY